MDLDARIDRLEDALASLAQAQARTEGQLGRLEEAVTRLAEAQARTEERLGRLEERMDGVEPALARLAEAQARTEGQLGQVAEALQTLARQVGGLAEAVGFGLEDLAREVTPAYLAQHYGIHGLELERRFFLVEGHELEVDLYGEGRRDGEAVAVIAEGQSRIHGRDVEGAVRQTARLAPQLRGTPVTVLFGFVIHPSAREAASRLGAIVISSSGRA